MPRTSCAAKFIELYGPEKGQAAYEQVTDYFALTGRNDAAVADLSDEQAELFWTLFSEYKGRAERFATKLRLMDQQTKSVVLRSIREGTYVDLAPSRVLRRHVSAVLERSEAEGKPSRWYGPPRNDEERTKQEIDRILSGSGND